MGGTLSSGNGNVSLALTNELRYVWLAGPPTAVQMWMVGGAQRDWNNEEIQIPTRDTPASVFTSDLSSQVSQVQTENFGSLPTDAGESRFAWARGGSTPRTVVHFFDGTHGYSSHPISLFSDFGSVGSSNLLNQIESTTTRPFTAYFQHESRGESPLVWKRGFYLSNAKETADQTKAVYEIFRSHSLASTLEFIPLASKETAPESPASSGGGGCGLVGIEALLALGLIAWSRRRPISPTK